MSDTVRLTEEFRGGLLDLTHYGYISIVDEKGKVIYSAGDPEAMVFYRSASKPVQALPVIAHRLDEKYGFTDEETVLFAGSHLGESFHVNALKSIMKKADLNPEDLIMKPTAGLYGSKRRAHPSGSAEVEALPQLQRQARSAHAHPA